MLIPMKCYHLDEESHITKVRNKAAVFSVAHSNAISPYKLTALSLGLFPLKCYFLDEEARITKVRSRVAVSSVAHNNAMDAYKLIVLPLGHLFTFHSCNQSPPANYHPHPNNTCHTSSISITNYFVNLIIYLNHQQFQHNWQHKCITCQPLPYSFCQP